MKPTIKRSPTLQRLSEQLAVLREQSGFVVLDTESFATFAAQPGKAVILFAEDPARVPESWDLTIILPEALGHYGKIENIRVGMMMPDVAKPLAGRYGIGIWPALLFLKDGAYVGVIEGLKDWDVYRNLVPQLLATEPSRAPGIGIAVRSAHASSHCH